MLEIDRDFYHFRHRDIWFSSRPFDVDGCQGVTFYACEEKVDAPGFTRTDFTTPVIDLTESIEQIRKNIEQSCRKKINKAYNNGIQVRVNEGYEEFCAIDAGFRKHKNLPASYISIEYMKKYGTLMVAELDGRVVSGQLFLEDRDHIRGLIASSLRFGEDGHANNVIGYGNRLIVWEAIRYAKAKGIREYDMGGYYTGTGKLRELEGINRYKLGFGPRLVTRYNYHKYYSRIFGVARRLYDYGSAVIYSRP